MKVGIMQPYFFPYIGYWQLLNLVDCYVVFDDVNYINRGWINRNRIINNKGEVQYFNLPCLGCSQNKLINQISVNNDIKEVGKKLRQIECVYKKAPYFSNVYPLMEKVMMSKLDNLAEYLKYSIEEVCKYINIDTKIIMSSSIQKNNDLRGQEKILDICSILNATDYYNAIGGVDLYDRVLFKKANINLHFLETKPTLVYHQFDEKFCNYLSIIDVMMFCNVDEITTMLTEGYTLK